MTFVDEETIQRTAAIIGPASAAAKALLEAQRRRENGDEVAFLKDRGFCMWQVESRHRPLHK